MPQNFVKVGQNVELAVEGSIMLVKVDLSKTQGRSASGKTTIIATTQGNILIPGTTNGETLGLNIYKK